MIKITNKEAYIPLKLMENIIKTSQLNLSNKAAAKIKRQKNITSMISRIRSDKPTYGPNPLSLADIVVPYPFRYRYSNELFIFYESICYEMIAMKRSSAAKGQKNNFC